jgi:hypothetical protein
MADMFDVDITTLTVLGRLYLRNGKELRKATGIYLNGLAFDAKDNSFSNLKKDTTIRNERFVKSRLRVKKTPLGRSIASQQSEVGSIKTERFTGWKELEFGETDPRSRQATMTARGQKRGRRVRPMAKMRKGRKFKRPEDFVGHFSHQRAQIMLDKLGREGYRQPFVVHGHKTIPSGLYKFAGGSKKKRKMLMLQRFKDRSTKIRKIKWLHSSVIQAQREAEAKRAWKKAIDKVIKWR